MNGKMVSSFDFKNHEKEILDLKTKYETNGLKTGDLYV
jgi:hypothetical protein